MTNKKRKDKQRVNRWQGGELYAKLKKFAVMRATTFSELTTDWVAIETKNIILTKEEHERIIQRIERESSKGESQDD